MSKERKYGLILLIIGLIIWLMIIGLVKLFIFLGYNTFFYFDNLIKITPFNPIIMWCVWGLFIGSIVGVIIAVKKYRLSRILILYPIGFISLLVTIMGFINKPADYNATFIAKPERKVMVIEKDFYILKVDANIRSGPSVKYNKLFVLKKGNLVELAQKGYFDTDNIEWYKIKIDSQEGYISSRLVKFSHTGN